MAKHSKLKAKKHSGRSVKRGFTLIELLIVIGILGVLAASVLVAINPLEQFAKGRDAGRVTSVSQLGHAVEAYYTAQSSTYPTANATWMTTLVNAGELKQAPTNPTGGTTCTTNAQSGFCFNANATDAVVFVGAESKASMTKGTCASAAQTFIVWSSAEGKTGIWCGTSGTPVPPVGVTGLR